MSKFIDREAELSELDALLSQGGAQFIMVHGRRRVGKTTLLLHLAAQSGLPVIYWMAGKDTPELARQSLARVIWGWAHEESDAAPRFDLWPQVFEMAARFIGDRQVIFILDEFPDAVYSDPALPSHLRAAWDQLFKDSNTILVLSGSHIGMMVDLAGYDAPLYGRFTARLLLEPLPFRTLREFLPRCSLEERVAVYAVLGGIPAYLERWNDRESLGANIKRLLFRRTGMFRSDPFLLISDVIRRETQIYEVVLKAVAAGHRTPGDISHAVGLSASHISPYLKRLVELYLLERRVPATVPLEKRASTNISRYYLRDPYLRFYFRFIDPNLHLVEQELASRLWEKIKAQFRAFVALTFEELCREWTLVQARADRLPLRQAQGKLFAVDVVGTHWSPQVQTCGEPFGSAQDRLRRTIDVVAVNWDEKQILLGECKWGENIVRRPVIADLIEVRAPKVLEGLPGGGDEWTIHYAFFARVGFTEAASSKARSRGAILVTLEQLNRDLTQMLQ